MTKAENDLNRIYAYISKDLDAEIVGISLIEKFEKNLLRLEEFSFSCSSVGDEFLKKKGYRKLIVKSYIGFYIVEEEAKEIVIMRFLYGKQRFEDIL